MGFGIDKDRAGAGYLYLPSFEHYGPSLSLSLSLNDVSLFASPVYTHVYTPRCPLS